MAKIFISYKRNIEPDTPIAAALYDRLNESHDVFIDTTILVGEKWADKIQNAIKEADFLISLISNNSVHSEMVVAEIETAHHHAKKHGKPLILPVRLNYNEALVYPLSAYLNPLQWALWNNDNDTEKVIAEIVRAISGGTLESKKSQNIIKGLPKTEDIPTAFANITQSLDSPEGTMPHQSAFYIDRQADHDATSAIREIDGVTITIKGPRQMGKSSLLNRLIIEGKKKSMKVCFIDFQLIESSVIENADVFYKQLCSLLSWELEIDDRTEEYWKSPLGPVQKTTGYLQRYILKSIESAPILLAMDEVERMFASPFRSDFFSMLRSWHNSRARGGDWKRINLAIVTSTEPYQFISDLNQSPFNVGQVIELTDFTFDQFLELSNRYNQPIDKNQTRQLFDLLGGHPYLSRRALYLMASHKSDFNELIQKALEDNGPFGDHLRNYLFRMSGQQALKEGLEQVLEHNRCPDEQIFFQLRGSGLVKRTNNLVFPRNQLYAEYFRKRLYG